MKPYPKYKYSGVEWIGEVPEGWKIKKLKHIAKIKTGYTPSKAEEDNYSADGIIWVKPDNLNQFTPIIDSKEKIARQAIKDASVIPKNSVLVCCIGSIGKFGVAGVDLVTNQQINSLIFNSSIEVRFGKYLISTAESEHIKEANGNVVKILNTEGQGRIFFAIPSRDEQAAIANYLDRKTAEIDRLIANKERLVELYEEEKTAMINQAVTKGLDPDAPMKPSGIDWLGDIPEHWETRKLRYLFEIKKRIAGELGHDVLSITQQGIKIKDTESMDGQISSDYSKYQVVEKGDFAMNHMDLLTGYVDISEYDGVTSPDYRVFSLIAPSTVDRYFLYLFQMGYKNKIFYAFGRGAAQFGRWRFPSDEFKEFKFPLPPDRDEQKAIAKHIETECSRLDTIIDKFKKQIKLIQEYRRTLISEVVTGKIDVRAEVII